MHSLNPPEQAFRILSLDGGGSWALLQTQALAFLFGKNRPGHEILSHFQLAISNSGGSLVLAGLICNKTPAELFALFTNERKRRSIFVEKPFAGLARCAKVGSRYRAAAKARGFRTAYESPVLELSLSAIAQLHPHLPPFILMGFDFHRERAAFFRSAPSPASSHSEPEAITLLDAINASSNAPVNYFDDAVEVTYGQQRRHMWDGAVGGFNNPILAGLTEAVSRGYSPQQVHVLSLGTGNEYSPMDYEVQDAELRPAGLRRETIVPEKKCPSSIRVGIAKMAGSILSEPPDSALFTSYVWMHGCLPPHTPKPLRLVRLNPLIQPLYHTTSGSASSDTAGYWSLPPVFQSPKAYVHFRNLDMDAVPQKDVEAIVRFGEAWLRNEVPNQPIQSTSKLQCKHGHPRANAAIADWEALWGAQAVGHLLTLADVPRAF